MQTSRRYFSLMAGAMIASVLAPCVPAIAQNSAPKSSVLITNANVFNGKSDKLAEGMSVLVEGNKIAKIAKSIPAPAGATIVDAAGRTLSPGFIDAHVHLTLQVNYGELVNLDESYFALGAADQAQKMLMRGFTTARDAGGNTFSLKRAIDEGRFAGPRIFPSGAGLSQTGGHGDYRPLNAIPRPHATEQQPMERVGVMTLADGEPEVLIAAREQLRKGASQVKLAAGGGVASRNDPLDVVQFTPAEIRAATQAAENWNTYVLAHVYNNVGIRLAVENGVKSIEHANYIDEKTLDLVITDHIRAESNFVVFLFLQQPEHRVQPLQGFLESHDLPCVHPGGRVDENQRLHAEPRAMLDPNLMARQNEEFTIRTKWFSNAEILRQATSGNADLLSMSGPRAPYPGKLGVIEEGAYADLLLINGDPLKDISILTKPEDTGTRSGLDAVENSSAPVVLSHANSREYFGSKRNTPNDLIKAVAKSGGVIGSVMYPSFVAENPTPSMADYVGHIDYLVQLVGIDHVAIASDYTNQISMTEAQQKAGYKQMIDSGAWDKKTYPYDVLTYPQGVETPKTLFNLTDALLARGYKKEDIAKLWGGNWVRVMKTVMG